MVFKTQATKYNFYIITLIMQALYVGVIVGSYLTEFVSVCLYVPCGHLLRKGCPLGSRLWCLTVNLSLSHWYPGLGVVLDLSIPDLCTLTYFVTFPLVSWVRCGT